MEAKKTWLAALEETDAFVRQRPAEESGCLYYSVRQKRFVVPRAESSLAAQDIELHFGAPGGVLPRMADSRLETTDPTDVPDN
jgi:hypothetical protein